MAEVVVAVVVIVVIAVVVAAAVGRTSGVFQLLEVFLQGMWAAQFEQLHLPSELGLWYFSFKDCFDRKGTKIAARWLTSGDFISRQLG